jgi:small-conductance mechanosensitive channel
MMASWKSWFEIIIFDNTVRDYALALFNLTTLVIVLMLLKSLFVRHLGKLAAKTTNDFDDFLVSLLAQVGAPVFIVTSLYFVSLSLHLGDQLRGVIRYALIIVLTIRFVFIFQEIVRYGIRKSYQRARPNDPTAEPLIKNLTNVVCWAIWAIGVVFVLDNLGINISTLVAGLGIGGIAVALAAQAVLGDLFSALSIFVDKPFEVGDFIIIDDLMGTVEYVGLKTTRIRSLSGEQIILSNSDLTKSRIKNYKRMELRRIAFKIGVVYQTSLVKVKEVPDLIREIFTKMKGVKLDRVHFASFGDFSLNYEIVYFVQSSDYNVYMDKQQEINFSIKELFEREQIEFAYPTQTVLVSGAAP